MATKIKTYNVFPSQTLRFFHKKADAKCYVPEDFKHYFQMEINDDGELIIKTI